MTKTRKNLFKYIPFYLFSIQPFWVLYIWSDLLFLITYYLFQYRREVVHTNLTKSFPDKNPVEIKKIEKDFYKHFSDVIVESAKHLTINEKEIQKRFLVKNPELIYKCFHENRNVLMYTAHFGNWEWLAAIPLYIPHKAITLYQPLSSKYFDSIIKKSRERFGALTIESRKGYKTLIQFSQQHLLTFSCIIGDQSPQKNSAKHWVTFLHQDTAFLHGADRIAKKRNDIVVFPMITKTKRGYYEIEFLTIQDNPKEVESAEIIEAYAKLLEKAINKSPHLWLWSHRRWKLQRELSL